MFAPGDIVKTGTIKKLSKQLKIKKLTLIRLKKMINKKIKLKVLDKATFCRAFEENF